VAILFIALLSGAPALLYEVVWTRQLALLVGGQVESISVVLVVFFGGLAVGSRLFGTLADRVDSPLRLYAALEVGAGILAAASTVGMRMLAAQPRIVAAPDLALLLAVVAMFPVTLLLGGTLPALLRASLPPDGVAAGRAGLLVGANTLGALGGILAAVVGIPTLGLLGSVRIAAASALALGAVAWMLAGRGQARTPLAPTEGRPAPLRKPVLAAAGAAGVATLAYEVLTARMAALTLGSSLYAWAAVLFLFLAGLALGNLALARRAAVSAEPRRDLGWIEIGAALAVAFGLLGLEPPLTRPASGLTLSNLLRLAWGSLPPAFLMGGAFPFFVRLGVEREAPGAQFGAVSAVNTAGGVVGALLAPFVLLPLLGPANGALVCAAVNGAIGAVFVRASGLLRPTLAVAAGALLWLALGPLLAPSQSRARVLFAQHGRQASVAVVRTPNRRDLLVDGDPEASTSGSARKTEELLASLPLVLHPDPRSFLEIGLGSGITLGTAARFPLEQIDCVELVPAVIAASAFFAPDNAAPASRSDDRIRIHRADGRAYLAAAGRDYDVIVANTLQPWSVGATGLYSHEYFARLSRRLAPGGVVAQWLPIAPIGSEPLAAIVRTFFDVFAEGAVFWGAENIIVLGSATPLPDPPPARFDRLDGALRATLAPLGIADPAGIRARRIASAADVRSLLGPAPLLHDDRPVLETSSLLGRVSAPPRGAIDLVARLAKAGAPSADGPLRTWIESQAARLDGREREADDLEDRAVAAGFRLAREARARRASRRGGQLLVAGDLAAAAAAYRRALRDAPDDPDARFGAAAVAFREGRIEVSERSLAALVQDHPRHAGAWSLLGAIRAAQGDLGGARSAYAAAISADPFLPEALANEGLLALQVADLPAARARLAALRAIDPGMAWPETRALAEAVAHLGHGS